MRALDASAVAEDAVAVDAHAVEVDVHEPPAAVERVRERACASPRPGTTIACTPSSPEVPGIARDDDELVDRVAFDDEPLLARRARRRSPSNTTVAATAAGSNEPPRSAIASAPGHSPAATAPRKRARWSAVPASRTAGTNWVTVASSGPGAITRPISSARMPASIIPSPMPPSASGTVSAGQPSSVSVAQSASGRTPSSTTRAGQTDRALLREHRADRVAQLVLIGGEFELHGKGQVRSWAISSTKARRSTFSPTVSGSASTTCTASGSL